MSFSAQWIGIDSPADSVLRACSRLGADIEVGPSTEHLAETIGASGSGTVGETLAAKEMCGRTLLYGQLVDAFSSADFIVRLSEELGCTVASGYAYSVSGSYFLCVANSGNVIRLFQVEEGDCCQLGEPLDSETLTPLDERYGEGVMRALESLGFPFETTQAQGPYISWRCTSSRRGAQGPLEEMISRTFAEAAEKQRTESEAIHEYLRTTKFNARKHFRLKYDETIGQRLRDNGFTKTDGHLLEPAIGKSVKQMIQDSTPAVFGTWAAIKLLLRTGISRDDIVYSRVVEDSTLQVACVDLLDRVSDQQACRVRFHIVPLYCRLPEAEFHFPCVRTEPATHSPHLFSHPAATEATIGFMGEALDKALGAFDKCRDASGLLREKEALEWGPGSTYGMPYLLAFAHLKVGQRELALEEMRRAAAAMPTSSQETTKWRNQTDALLRDFAGPAMRDRETYVASLINETRRRLGLKVPPT